jgi:ubiquinone biosynthesis protein COQ9
MASVRHALGAVARPGAIRCAAIARLQTAPYHSYDHPKNETSRSTSEQAILSAAYAHIPSHGFSPASLALGAKDAGFPEITTSILPNGPFSLVEFHLVTRRKALAAQSRQIFPSEESAKVGDKVERLTWERLLANEAVIHRWQEVCDFSAQHVESMS